MVGEDTPRDDNSVGVGETYYSNKDSELSQDRSPTKEGELTEDTEIVLDRSSLSKNITQQTQEKSENYGHDSRHNLNQVYIAQQRENMQRIREKIEKNDVNTSTLYNNLKKEIDNKVEQRNEASIATAIEQLERVGTHEAGDAKADQVFPESRNHKTSGKNHIKHILSQPKYQELKPMASRSTDVQATVKVAAQSSGTPTKPTAYMVVGFIAGVATLIFMIVWQQL